jgi:hypothetical protein
VMRAAPAHGRRAYIRLAFYQGVYATMLQLYVARAMYLDPETRLRGLRPDHVAGRA